MFGTLVLPVVTALLVAHRAFAICASDSIHIGMSTHSGGRAGRSNTSDVPVSLSFLLSFYSPL